MTIKELFQHCKEELTSYSPTPELDTRALFSYFLNMTHSELIVSENKTLEKEKVEILLEVLEKRKSKTPIAYITNSKEFFGREFFVDNRVLIPRPETEEIIEHVLNTNLLAPLSGGIKNKSLPDKGDLEGLNRLNILDLGTGSGCIAITIKKEKSKWNVVAADISNDALSIAKKNAKNFDADIQFVESDLLSNIITKQKFDIIIANLPYVAEDAKHPSVEQEPDLALYSGPDGLNHYRKLATQLQSKNFATCKKLYIEIGDAQAGKIKDIFTKAKEVILHKDLAGLFRFAEIIYD